MLSKHNFIERKEKKNVPFSSIPFCIEKGSLIQDDVLHIHDFSQLTMITAGNAEIIINGHPLAVQKGDVYFIGSFSSHVLKNPSQLQFINILFDLKDLLEAVGKLKAEKSFVSFFLMQPEITEDQATNRMHLDYDTFNKAMDFVDLMLKEIDEENTGGEVITNSSFLSLIVFLTRAYNQDKVQIKGELSLGKAIRYIEAHYLEDISVKELAALCYMSERQFRQQFQENYQCSPKQFVIDLKLKKACYLLTYSSHSIGEIAEICGFSDPSYFTRLFRKKIGKTPREYSLANK